MDFEKCSEGFISRLDTKDFAKLEKMEVVGAPKGFSLYPHGVSIFDEKLFVINHSPNFPRGNGVTVFSIEGNQLVWEKDVVHVGFVSLNAIVATSEEEFFVTNDRAFGGNALLSLVEDVFGLQQTVVFQCNGSECKPVIEGLQSVTIGLDHRNGHLFVVQALSSEILAFDTIQFELKKRITLDTSPDNIHFDKRGRMWAGCHPNILTTFQHLLTGSKAPSHVIASGENNFKFETIYFTKESDIVNGVSTGQIIKDVLVLGTMRDGFAVCRKK
jgi:hypothetical protein